MADIKPPLAGIGRPPVAPSTVGGSSLRNGATLPSSLGLPARGSSSAAAAAAAAASGSSTPAAVQRNRGRVWLQGKLRELEEAQTQYVLTAGMILRHHIDSRQLGLALNAIRAPQPLLEHLERMREEYTWVRAEIEQYAGRLRTEVPVASPDPPPAILPVIDANPAARAIHNPRPPQPLPLLKTQTYSGAAPSYLKPPPAQQHPSPLRNSPTTASAPPVRPQAVSAPGSSANLGQAMGTATGQPELAAPSAQARTASTSQLQGGPGHARPPATLPSPVPSAAPQHPSPAQLPAALAVDQGNDKPRPKPKPRLNHPVASAPGSSSNNPISLDDDASTSNVNGQRSPVQPAPAPPPAAAPPAQLPQPQQLKLSMPRPSDFLPGGVAGPPEVPAQVQQQQEQPPQQPLVNLPTGQNLTAADVENMTSEEAQRIIDSFQTASDGGGGLPPQGVQPQQQAPGVDIFDPNLLADIDMSMMGDLFAGGGGGDGGGGADAGTGMDLSGMMDLGDGVDWDQVMKTLAAEAPAQGP